MNKRGVTIPNNEAITFPVNVFLPSRVLRVRSGVKNVLIIPTKNIISVSNNKTFGNSKIKNQMVSAKCSPFVIPKSRKDQPICKWFQIMIN